MTPASWHRAELVTSCSVSLTLVLLGLVQSDAGMEGNYIGLAVFGGLVAANRIVSMNRIWKFEQTWLAHAGMALSMIINICIAYMVWTYLVLVVMAFHGCLFFAVSLSVARAAEREAPAKAPMTASELVQEHGWSRWLCAKNEEYAPEMCAICLSAFDGDDVLLRCPSAHIFHNSCMEEWLTKGGCGCPMRCDAQR